MRIQFKPLNASFDSSRIIHISPKTTTSLIIGRSKLNDTTPQQENLLFQNRVVSRYHATLFIKDGKLFLQDTKSTSGTFINGYRLSPPNIVSNPFELYDKDQIQLGEKCRVDGVEHLPVLMQVIYQPEEQDLSPERQATAFVKKDEPETELVELDEEAEKEFNILWRNLSKIKEPFERLESLLRFWDQDIHSSHHYLAASLDHLSPLENVSVDLLPPLPKLPEKIEK